MIKLTDEQIQLIAEDLQGTGKLLDQAICDITDEEAEGLDEIENWQALCDRVDQLVFLCEGCGWWCEVGDYAEIQENPNGDVCSNCGPDEEEEDA